MYFDPGTPDQIKAIAERPQVNVMRAIYKIDPDTGEIVALDYINQRTPTPDGYLDRWKVGDGIKDGTIKYSNLRAT